MANKLATPSTKPRLPRVSYDVTTKQGTLKGVTGQVVLSGLSRCGTLESQKILQSVGESILPLVLMFIKPCHVLQLAMLLPNSASTIKVSQELLQVLQASPKPLGLQQHHDLNESMGMQLLKNLNNHKGNSDDKRFIYSDEAIEM